MGKLYGSDAENILKKASGVFGDKGFIGTTYITTPIRKRPDIPVAARDRPQQELTAEPADVSRRDYSR